MIYGLCEALKASSPDLRVHSTYLDPVSIYGGLFWDWGTAHFGRCADFAEAYIDTEDGVPGSDVQLPHAHTFDVTPARLRSGSGHAPHVWPTHYYLALAHQGRTPSGDSTQALARRFRRGTMTTVQTIPAQAAR